MKVLIIGGTGLIGGKVANHLTGLGYDVHTLSRNEPFQLINGINHFKADIRDVDSITKVISFLQPEVLIQAAWITQHNTYQNSEENLNYQKFTIALGKSLKNSSVRLFIGIGSSAEYALHDSDLKLLVTPYSKAKNEVFRELNEFFKSTDIKFQWLRIFQPYGEFQDKKRFVRELIDKALKKETVIVQNPNIYLDWISTYDIAAAVEFTLRNEITGIVDIGTGIGTSNLDLTKLIFAETKSDVRNIKVLNEQQVKLKLIANVDSALFSLGWRPKFDLKIGIHNLIKILQQSS